MFYDWSSSGMTIRDFITSRGMNPKTGNVGRKTQGWRERVKREATTEVSSTPILPKESALEVVRGPQASDTKPAAIPETWQQIAQWRRNQAVEDYKFAETLRTHVKLILKNSLKKVTDDVTKKEEYVSTLKAHEARALTQAGAEIQRIQRLALGLSTENVGVNDPARPDSMVERQPQPVAETLEMKNVTPALEPIPVFRVVMSSRGRFNSSRPQRAQ